MRATGKPGMTDEQVAAFVSCYIPAYTAYLPGLYASGPTTVKPGHCLVIEVDGSRSPVLEQPASPV
jgi:D-glycerate 3-kinase